MELRDRHRAAAWYVRAGPGYGRAVTRLRRVDCAGPGITRKRAGRGFAYFYEDGRKVTEPEVLARIRELVIPPAWEGVWICPHPNGHIQATGTDDAGRRQYRYHDAWREQRDREKHDHVLTVARRLPRARRVVAEHLHASGYPRERVLAAAFRLLDMGFFRIGSEQYAEDNGSFGLATMRREHVHVSRGAVVFDYPAKGGKQLEQRILDDELATVVRGLLRRRDHSQELLAYKRGRTWYDVRSDEVNAYLRDVVGVETSAKDFRTWHATVLMAVALAMSREVANTPSKRKRAVARAYREVADYLGNTPAVARKSYVDPRVVDLYDGGTTVRDALERAARISDDGPLLHGRVEQAVLRMLSAA
jgi:DNA topoisomerase-1